MKLTRLLALVGTILLSCSAWAQTDVTSTYLTNAGFETSPTFDGTSLGSNVNPKSNATPTDGSVLLSGAKNVYQISGWTLMTTETSDFARTFTLPYETSLYINSNNTVANQQVTAPSNGSSVTEGNSNVLFVEANWCDQALLGVKQVVNLPAGKYTLTFDTYVTTNLNYGTSRCGVSYADKSTYKWPASLNTWTNNEITFTLSDATDVTISMGYLKNANQGGGNSPFLFVDNVKLTYTAIVVKDVLETALTAATAANTVLSDATLATAITTAQGVYDDENATQDEVNAAAATLNAATEIAMSEAGDVTGIFLSNPGFESCDVTTTNAAASGSAAPLNIAGNWTQVSSAAWSSSAVVAYGGSGQVNGVSAPANDNDGNSGNAFGVSVGWGGLVTYQSNAVTLPAGVYTLKVNAYNANSKTQFTSKFGFVPTEGAASLSTKTSFTSNSWVTDQVIFTLNEATEGKIQIGGQAVSGGSGDNAKVFLDNITISYSSFLAGAKAAYDEAVANAATAKSANSNVTGSELVALNTELGKSEPTTVDGYNDATEAINNAIDALVAAAPAYNALVTEIAYAGTLGINTDDAEAAMDSEATAASVTTATQTLKEDEYWNLLYTDYPNDVTSFLGVWPAGNYGTTSGQGYINDESYFDKWNGSAMDLTSSSTVELPAGKYVVCVAGRGVSSTTMNLSVKVGDADPVSTPFLMIGDTGKGIDTEGDTNFDEGGTYSNNNVGRGWQYRYITFTTTGGDVTITISGHLNAGTWQSFYAPVLKCDDDTYAPIAIAAAKADLNTAIAAATAARKEANEGTGVFQIPTANGTALATAITDAQAVYDDSEATLMEVATAQVNVEAAQYTYETNLNDPVDGQIFNVVLTSGGWTYDQKAMTYMAGDRNDMGGYNIKYHAAANSNLAQAFTFTKFTGNNYKMSQVDADGNVRYLCTGTPYSGNNSQIRTTTNAEDALIVTVIPTATAGVWNLKNSFASEYIGSQDEGVFTVNSHIDFNIVEASKPSISVNIGEGKYATRIFPFAPTLPDGIVAYSCEAQENGVLTLEEVAVPAANVPYILYSENGYSGEALTGNALGKETTYTAGWLTGVYASTAVPTGSYVLQTLNEKQAFYIVDNDGKDEEHTVKAPANRVYLTVPAAPGVKAFFFDEATGIENLNVNDNLKNEAIYNVAGQRVSKAQKGLYIKNGKKVVIK